MAEERGFKTVSLPLETVEGVDAFVEQYGRALGYRGRADFIQCAIRTQRTLDERRILRQKALANEDQEAELWADL